MLEEKRSPLKIKSKSTILIKTKKKETKKMKKLKQKNPVNYTKCSEPPNLMARLFDL